MLMLEQKITIECKVESQLAKADECQNEYQYRIQMKSISSVIINSPIILTFSF